ncbi:MAG: hypothetical protein HGA44_06835 [Cellulomonadaceae bacterium]|nr:hypothetical protein [Cellulomonadaceae bacterium]
MLTAGAATPPDWFDWLTLIVTALAAVVPAWLAIALWRSDRRSSIDARRDAAAREFTHLLATGDRVLVRFRDFDYFASAMGPGAAGLLDLIWRLMESDADSERAWERHVASGPSEEPGVREPRLDLSVDVSDIIARWRREPDYRADLTEVYLANGTTYPAEEDNRIISPGTRREAEDAVLREAHLYGEWLAGTRLAPARIRRRRALAWLGFNKTPSEPLNPLAQQTWLEEDDLPPGDAWLRDRSTAEFG